MTTAPSIQPPSAANDHTAQIGAWLEAQPERENEGQAVRAEPVYIRADDEYGVALVALRALQPDGSQRELPFESWWFRFDAGRIYQAWSL